MNWLKILSKEEKNLIQKQLERQFGIKKLPGLIVKKGKERLFLFIGYAHPKEIKDIEAKIIVERVGIYFAKEEASGIRLSMEGTQLLKDQISKNTFELDEKQVKEWMYGNEINVSTGKKGFVVMKHKNDFLGCGKASEEKITNFVPKTRRLKYKEN